MLYNRIMDIPEKGALTTVPLLIYNHVEIRTNVLIIQFCKSFLFLYVYGKEGKG